MKRVLVIFGSMSSEHEVSCMSAANVIENINKEKYIVSMVGIDKQGNWYKYNGSLENIKNNTWMLDEKNKEKISYIIDELRNYDVVFPVLHGKYGEDGTIQGIFEIAGVKYVGCKVLASSIAMNKTFSKKLVETENIPVVDYVNISREKYLDMCNDINIYKEFCNNTVEKLGLPLFVKPNQEGSSYGVTKVDDIEKLKEAISYALEFDNDVLIEKYIKNKKEVECAILQDGLKLIVSTPGQIKIKDTIYSYDEKYNDSSNLPIIPAHILKEQEEKIKEYSKRIFKILNLSSLARIDFFVTDNNIFFNEVNTMPGFTNTSMYPKLLMYDGISYNKIIEILIENV